MESCVNSTNLVKIDKRKKRSSMHKSKREHQFLYVTVSISSLGFTRSDYCDQNFRFISGRLEFKLLDRDS